MIARTPETLQTLLRESPGASPSTFLADDGFASWCYDRLSAKELRSKRRRDPDPDECRRWGLSQREWRAQVEMALIARLAAGGDPF